MLLSSRVRSNQHVANQGFFGLPQSIEDATMLSNKPGVRQLPILPGEPESLPGNNMAKVSQVE